MSARIIGSLYLNSTPRPREAGGSPFGRGRPATHNGSRGSARLPNVISTRDDEGVLRVSNSLTRRPPRAGRRLKLVLVALAAVGVVTAGVAPAAGQAPWPST